MPVSQIEIRQGEEHIQLSHLFSSTFVMVFSEVEQILHYTKVWVHQYTITREPLGIVYF